MNPSAMNQDEDQTNIIRETQLVQDEEVEQLKQSLEKANFMGSNKLEMIKYQGFWSLSIGLKPILYYQRHFHARDTDIFISSLPKTGTTWLKSLLFSIVNRVDHHHPRPSNKINPLLTHNPHELVYHLDSGVYGGDTILPSPHQLQDLPSPRLLHTHVPYASLPESIKVSSCKILYIARNPLDTCVSHWHFYSKILKKAMGDQDFQPPSIEDFFEDFCQGRVQDGPYFEHVVGYWKQSLEQPNKVLFLKYEDIKDDPTFHLKKLAKFIGLPFSPQEEIDGVIDDIIKLCSIESLKELEVNKTGKMNKFMKNDVFFRKGEVGDWTNYFTPTMVDKIKNMMEQKFEGTGLFFNLLPQS